MFCIFAFHSLFYCSLLCCFACCFLIDANCQLLSSPCVGTVKHCIGITSILCFNVDLLKNYFLVFCVLLCCLLLHDNKHDHFVYVDLTSSMKSYFFKIHER